MSKPAKDFKEYTFLEWMKTFVQPRKSKFNFPKRTDDLEINGREGYKSGSDYHSHFGEDQDEESQFLMSDMGDEQKNFSRINLNPVSKIYGRTYVEFLQTNCRQNKTNTRKLPVLNPLPNTIINDVLFK